MSKKIGKLKQLFVVRLLILLAGVIGIDALCAQAGFAGSEAILHTFGGAPDGANARYRLIQDGAGNLYGVTQFGGAYGGGTLYELSFEDGAWVESILHSFGASGDGFQPWGALLLDGAGNLYGVASGGQDTGIVYRLGSDGHGNWTETILKSFGGSISSPVDALTMDAGGNLYGVADAGGSNGFYGNGAVYRLSPPAKTAKEHKWKYALLYKFLGAKHDDGAGPNGDLIFDAAGNLYGTTKSGGLYNDGTVFELSPGSKTWTEKILHNFQVLSDGGAPVAGLTFDSAGSLYGTAMEGGSGTGGVVFELSQSGGNWTESVLYSFTGKGDGANPWAPVTLYNGNLYGTTACGGNGPLCSGTKGEGVVFELSPSGAAWTERVLHTFKSPPDGSYPVGGVVVDFQGNLYGTTFSGGAVGNGVVYEIPK
jgi:uncharacterized repeat protein (TIGR03803 family)